MPLKSKNPNFKIRITTHTITTILDNKIKGASSTIISAHMIRVIMNQIASTSQLASKVNDLQGSSNKSV